MHCWPARATIALCVAEGRHILRGRQWHRREFGGWPPGRGARRVGEVAPPLARVGARGASCAPRVRGNQVFVASSLRSEYLRRLGARNFRRWIPQHQRAAVTAACFNVIARNRRRKRRPTGPNSKPRGGGRGEHIRVAQNLELARRVGLLVRTLHRPLPTTFRLSTASHDARPCRGSPAGASLLRGARCRRRRSCAGAAATRSR